MLSEDEVKRMKTLWEMRWRVKRIARETGHGKNTVKRYVRAWDAGKKGPSDSSGGPGRKSALAGVSPDWLKGRLERHDGNADVVRQELARELGVVCSLRTVERAVEGFRQEMRAETLATVRFETPPGKQLQVDFGTKTVMIAGAKTRVHLCVLTLGFSRRIYVEAFKSERQANWFSAIEGAFRHFGGVTEQVLVDNARALVDHNDGDGNVTFNAGFKAFCDHWGIRPKACRPYRARTKGKDERAVQYVKGNALAGREFGSWAELEAHLCWWMREISDCRVHQTTKEAPQIRFDREELQALLPLQGQKPYQGQQATASRIVKTDTTVDFKGNAYSVPYRLIGKEAAVTATGDTIEIAVGGGVVARHQRAPDGSGARVIASEHLKGVMRLWGATKVPPPEPPTATGARKVVGDSALLRSLEEYAALFDLDAPEVVGGVA
jgi:transposase